MSGILKAIKNARSLVPALPATETGIGDDGKPFTYPDKDVLRDAIDSAVDRAGLFELPEDMTYNSNQRTIAVRWTFHHLGTDKEPGTGDTHTITATWPVPTGDGTGIGIRNATAASTSHAWRHAMMLLFKVRTYKPGDATPPTPGKFPAPDELAGERDVAGAHDDDMPAWSGPAALTVTGEPQWEQAGAVLGPSAVDCHDCADEDMSPTVGPVAPADDPAPLADVWEETRERLGFKGLFFAYREFSNNPLAQLLPVHGSSEEQAFKQWLRARAKAKEAA